MTDGAKGYKGGRVVETLPDMVDACFVDDSVW